MSVYVSKPNTNPSKEQILSAPPPSFHFLSRFVCQKCNFGAAAAVGFFFLVHVTSKGRIAEGSLKFIEQHVDEEILGASID
jgi:hypothetical protein